MKDNHIYKGKSTLNIWLWAIVVYGYAFYLYSRFDFNPLWLLLGMFPWLIMSFVVDQILGLTEKDTTRGRI